MLCDVVEGVDAPVQFVDRCSMRVNFRCKYAFASEITQCRVEPADSGKEVNERKWHLFNLTQGCHVGSECASLIAVTGDAMAPSAGIIDNGYSELTKAIEKIAKTWILKIV